MKWANDAIDSLHDKNIIKIRTSHLKQRLFVSLALLVLSALGVFVTVFAPAFAWHYWLIIVPIFALLCLSLSWMVARNHALKGETIWHEIVHWLALLAAVFLVSTIVNAGVINYLAGALFVLILLAFSIFLAGVYFDSMFMPIGLLLGLLAAGSAFFVRYMIIILIPLILIAAFLLVWRFMHHRQKIE